MTHVTTNSELPGIQELFAFRPETAAPLRALAQQILRGPSSLTEIEREIIASVVSTENACTFCALSHEAAACALAGDDKIVERARTDAASFGPKMQALLEIAMRVVDTGLSVDRVHIAKAREAGADDIAIHDTILVAAAFCMFNRYVDGLAARTPDEREDYLPLGKLIAEKGYVR
jgi:uncharacterized peroxidase-related enzyme